MPAATTLPHVQVASRAEWRGWLAAHHAQAGSVWLVTFRKHVPDRHLPYDAVVEEALCFGWVDSLPRALDADRTMLLLSPRRRGSAWSALNKARAERMMAAGLMTSAGTETIEAAKRNGGWTKLDAVEALTVPGDLADALAARPPAAERFAAFPRSVRRGILEWIGSAKRPETRARRMDETARLAAEDRRANQFERKKR